MRPLRHPWILLLAVLLAGLIQSGCATSGQVTGVRNQVRPVRVGDEVRIVLPASSPTPEWRLVAFDSLKLPMIARLRLEEAGGENAWVARFEARVPGRADVVFARTAASGAAGQPAAGERFRFSFRIRE